MTPLLEALLAAGVFVGLVVLAALPLWLPIVAEILSNPRRPVWVERVGQGGSVR